MATSRKPPTGPVPVEAIKHEDKRRNIPTADSEELLDEEAARPARLRYDRDTSLDPQLVWKGKDEQDGEDLVVDAPPIYIQEKIVPQVIIENLRRVVEQPELTLFADFDGLSGWEAVEYYQHDANWSNRMILGDSLQVMGSLAEKENLRGKVQMIYIDPPYGIKFGSNWQVSTGKREVKDGKLEDTTREVEQVKAFRDTWELGIHSYLSYLRDRLFVARDLLTESGSVFVQIGDENVHLVRSLLDEVFGSENCVAQIYFKTTTGRQDQHIDRLGNYVLWFAKVISRLKSRKLYTPKIETKATSAGDLQSQGVRSTGSYTVTYSGRDYRPQPGNHWKVTAEGMARLIAANRIVALKNVIRFERHANDFPLQVIGDVWVDTSGGAAADKIYVVQTGPKIIERCILLSTDPGDLVLDPTCGSGTASFVAEEWGRRWITIDTSRVALALARQRIMGAKFPYYLLSDSSEGRAKEAEIIGQRVLNDPTSGDIRKGFVYERVPHVKLETIARNPHIKPGMSRKEIDATITRHAEIELLYDRPYKDPRKVRVAGRFTVESLSPHRTIAPAARSESEQVADQDDASVFERTILDNLLRAGVQNGRKKERLAFETLAPFPGRYIQAEGIRKNGAEGTPQRIGVSIGPQFGTVDPEWIRKAAREATHGQGFDLLLVCAFAFDPQAVKAAQEFAPSDPGHFATVQAERRLGRVPILLVRMNSDLAMGDVLLKKTGSANLFMVFGEPDVAIERTPDGVVVEIRGVDVYNPTTGEIRSNGTGEIALWMIDTDYDGESFFVRRCYFTGGNDPYARLKKALKADIDEAAWA